VTDEMMSKMTYSFRILKSYRPPRAVGMVPLAYFSHTTTCEKVRETES